MLHVFDCYIMYVIVIYYVLFYNLETQDIFFALMIGDIVKCLYHVLGIHCIMYCIILLYDEYCKMYIIYKVKSLLQIHRLCYMHLNWCMHITCVYCESDTVAHNLLIIAYIHKKSYILYCAWIIASIHDTGTGTWINIVGYYDVEAARCLRSK